MNKIALISMTLCLMAGSLFAQYYGDSKKFSLLFSTGWGFGIGGVNNAGQVDLRSVTRDGSGNPIESKDYYLNFASGFRLGGGIQYRIMDNVDSRLEFQFTAGIPKMKVKDIDPTRPGQPEITDTYTRNLFGMRLLALPAFRLFNLIDMHAGVGIGLFFASFTYERTGEPYEGYLKTLPAFAFSGCIDMDYPIAEYFALFGGFSFDAMSFTVKTQRETDDPAVIHFEKNSIAPNEPTPPKIPGSNWAITVGARIPLF